MPASNDVGILFMGFVTGSNRDQVQLFPEALDDLIPADHSCRVIDAFVGHLDLGALGFVKATPKSTGRPPYDPADLLKLYLYGYLNRVRSSRRLERECQRNVEVMWLLNRLIPDHKTIAEFRRHNGSGLRRAGAAFVAFCQQAGLIRGDWIAVDGSKFKAVASHKAVMARAELEQRQQRAEQQIGVWLQALEEADQDEEDSRVDPEAVRAALTQLTREASREAAAVAEAPATAERITIGEPEARVMKGHGPAYNLQIAVDAAQSLIVTHTVTTEATDNRSLQPMAEAAAEVLGSTSFKVVADAGYSNGEQFSALEQQGIEPHVPVARAVNNQGDGQQFDRSRFSYEPTKDTYTCPAGKTLVRKQLMRRDQRVLYAGAEHDCGVCPLKVQCTRSKVRLVTRHLHEESLERMAQRCTAQDMRLRRSTVEHPFGTLKYQVMEQPRFLLRGRWGAGTEMALAVLAYNMKRALAVLGAARMTCYLTAG
jgi:transposase